MSTQRWTIAAFETDLGYMAIAADSNGVLEQVWFDYSSESELRSAIKTGIEQIDPTGCRFDFQDNAHAPLVRRFKKFAQGRVDTFDDVKINVSGITPFQRKVVNQARRIPYGQTMSYGELARRAQAPGAARAVGSVMAKNRFPLVVPCHRVVASGHRLGGFSSRRGLATKGRLLQMEGAINEKGALIG